jgi:hypothetical protein
MILVGIILLVPTFFSLLIRIPEVQTFIVNRITGHFSESIRSGISVGRVEYTFFNKLVLSDVLVKDQHQDTLLYSESIAAGITGINPGKKAVRLGNIELKGTTFGLITDTSGVMNLKWYLGILSPENGRKGEGGTSITINQITLKDGAFRLINRMNEESNKPVDFNNLIINGINGKVNDLSISGDTVAFGIRDLSFTESGGFTVRSMNSDVIIANQDKIFRNLFLYLDSSIINADRIILDYDTSVTKRNFADDVRLDILLQNSVISSADLKFFIPSLNGISEMVELSGRINGPLSELNGRNIRLFFRDHTSLECDFDFSGLPKIRDTFIHISISSLKTKAEDLEKIRKPDQTLLNIPDILYTLGSITFTGSFTGFTNDFVTYGKLGSEIGSISTDISLRPEQRNNFRIKGLVRGSSIDLGQVTGKSELLGRMSMETNIDGYASSLERISGNVSGKIDSVEINNYIYRNIDLSGIFTEKTWDGSVKISDNNIRMDLLGMFDFRNELPEFDFTLNLGKSNLYRLNFDKSDSTSRLAALLTANFRGNNIDNLFGEIKLLNSTLTKHGSTLELYDFSLKAFNEDSRPAISLRTDFVNADLRGYYEFGEIGDVIKKALARLMPSKFIPPKRKNGTSRNDFAFTLDFRNSDKINSFFRTKLLLSDKSSIRGELRGDTVIRVDAELKKLDYRNNVFNDLEVTAAYLSDKFSADIKSSSLSLLGMAQLKDFGASMYTRPDNFMFRLGWDDKDKIPNRGTFVAGGEFTQKSEGSEASVLKIEIDSSEIYSNGNRWKIRHSSIMVDSGMTHVDRFAVSGLNSLYAIDGSISGNPSDTVKIEFRGIDISPASRIGKKENGKVSPGYTLDPGGIVNGNVVISSALKNPLIQSNISIDDFSILGEEFGNVFVLSAWNPGSKVADIRVENNSGGKKNLEVTGTFDPARKLLLLDALARNLPVSGLNPFLDIFASDIKGTTSGKLQITKRPGEMMLRGSLMAEDISMKIDFLQAGFILHDSIRFDREGIKFRNVRLTDERGNNALLAGSVLHRNFKDFSVDLSINMDKNACLVLNTQEKDNETFYGTVFATGITTIKSSQNNLSFDISARTSKGTRFFIPLNSAMSVSEYSFVNFVTPDSLISKDIKKVQVASSSGSSMELNLDLDVTPDAEVQMLIDPKAGDVIRGRGAGTLNISLNRKGEFRIYGDYLIEEGDYLFTLQNLLNKRFDVENGGRITFNGDVENAEIDITAKYRNLRTSLYPILYPVLQDERYTARIAVEPQLKLSGRLFNPVVGFNIFLPNADEETRTYLRNAITSEEELSKQFLYLLVMNSFYSNPNDPSYQAPINTSTAGTSAMAVTTTEMLSNQLSNWLSQISNDFDVGFHYSPGTKNINSQELQVALSTQLLNDRVTINGNFDVRGENNSEGTPLSGDFDIEYKITEKIRFKAFNRYNSPYTGRGVPYTQGLGIFFKQDFDRLSDLFRRKDKSEFRKEEEISIEE